MKPETNLKTVPTIWQLVEPRAAAAAPGPMFRGSDWAREPQVWFRAHNMASVLEWYIECEVNGRQLLEQTIDVDPDVRGGVAVLKGTGFTVAQTLAEIAEGPAADELARRFNLRARDIREMLNGLSLMLQRPLGK